MNLRENIRTLVDSTPLADTHEHLMEEATRLVPGDGSCARDIAALFTFYSESDLIASGLQQDDLRQVMKHGVPYEEKWRLLKPFYDRSRNTGYLQAVRIAVRTLYGEDDLTDESIGRVNEKFAASIQPGITRWLLKGVANIDHCQVNSSSEVPFVPTQQPDLLLQDISLYSLVEFWWKPELWRHVGTDVTSLADYHKLVDTVFDRYASSATAVKNQANYYRRLDFEDVKAKDIAAVFERGIVDPDSISSEETKAIQDHVFHYGVRRATEHGLPVKLHCGYLAGANRMPLERLVHNGGDICKLLVAHPDTKFVFMHINYPYQDELIAVCKQYTNAYADMCWAWGINPAASARFLREFLMAVPANKVFTFGGDVAIPELTVGYAAIARRGISGVVAGLVEDGLLAESDAPALVERIVRGNARELFRIPEKFGI